MKGEILIKKVCKQSNGACVYLPKSWIGEQVKIINQGKPEPIDLDKLTTEG